MYRTMDSYVWRRVVLNSPTLALRWLKKLTAIPLTSPRNSGAIDVSASFLNPINI